MLLETLRKESKAKIVTLLFIGLTVWWLVLLASGIKEAFNNYLFGALYGLVALLGGIWGIKTAMRWGGFKSVMGKAIMFLSLGLLAEEFGQLVFSYYNIFLHVQVPYPSLADLGYFANIPLYLLGIIYLGRASGIQFSLKKLSGRLQLIIFPLIMLILAYIFFLQGYEFDWLDPLKIFLDFGYPFGQALYISIAILTLSLSQKVLGGIMRDKIIFIIFAFVAQFLADYNFLFQSSRGTWYNAGYGDYLYLLAYFIMTLGLLQLHAVANKFRK